MLDFELFGEEIFRIALSLDGVATVCELHDERDAGWKDAFGLQSAASITILFQVHVDRMN